MLRLMFPRRKDQYSYVIDMLGISYMAYIA